MTAHAAFHKVTAYFLCPQLSSNPSRCSECTTIRSNVHKTTAHRGRLMRLAIKSGLEIGVNIVKCGNGEQFTQNGGRAVTPKTVNVAVTQFALTGSSPVSGEGLATSPVPTGFPVRTMTIGIVTRRLLCRQRLGVKTRVTMTSTCDDPASSAASRRSGRSVLPADRNSTRMFSTSTYPESRFLAENPPNFRALLPKPARRWSHRSVCARARADHAAAASPAGWQEFSARVWLVLRTI